MQKKCYAYRKNPSSYDLNKMLLARILNLLKDHYRAKRYIQNFHLLTSIDETVFDIVINQFTQPLKSVYLTQH